MAQGAVVWTSGKVLADSSVHVSYAGPALPLLAGVHDEALVVPYWHDHFLESAHKDASRAHEPDRFLFDLSDAIAIRTEPDMTERLLPNHGRRRPGGIRNFCEKHAIMGFDKPDNFG